MSITKIELADLVYEHIKVDKKRATELVDAFFEELKKGLVEEGNIQISGFGKFVVKHKKKRKGRNPQTEKSMMISERNVATFYHSHVLKKRLNS